MIDNYLQQLQESVEIQNKGPLNAINCKRLQLSLKGHRKDIEGLKLAIKKEKERGDKANLKRIKFWKEGIVGLQSNIERYKSQYKAKCSG